MYCNCRNVNYYCKTIHSTCKLIGSPCIAFDGPRKIIHDPCRMIDSPGVLIHGHCQLIHDLCKIVDGSRTLIHVHCSLIHGVCFLIRSPCTGIHGVFSSICRSDTGNSGVRISMSHRCFLFLPANFRSRSVEKRNRQGTTSLTLALNTLECYRRGKGSSIFSV